MSDTEEPRGGTIRRRLLTAFAAVAVPPVLLLAALVLILLSRSFERTAESRLRDGIAAVEGRLARMEGAARAKVVAVAREDLPVAADADLPSLATESGERRDLAVLEIVGADGTILSSLHWPVGFGLREQDRTFEGAPRFRIEKVSEGYGAEDRLVLVAELKASLRGQAVVVRGGSFVDGELLDELSRLMAAEVAVRDEAGRRWIAAVGSPLATWPAPPGGVEAGEVTLRGESFRWRARALAPGLSLVVAIPRSAIDEVMGGVGRSTLIAAIVALAGALLAASLLSARIAAPVRARFDRMAEELAASRERVLQAERVAAWREMAQAPRPRAEEPASFPSSSRSRPCAAWPRTTPAAGAWPTCSASRA